MNMTPEMKKNAHFCKKLGEKFFLIIDMNSKHLFYSFLILILYSLNLDKYSVPLTGDEKTYTSIAMEMWSQKSWIYPIFFGEHSYYKPPLQFWITLMSWKLFGFGNFGTYFPSVLALAGTAWFIRKIQILLSEKIRVKENESLIADVWFAGCFGAVTYGTTLQMEIWITFFYTGIWFLILQFLCTNHWKWFYCALLMTGLSGLVKSPLYSIFSILSFWLYFILEKKLKYFRSPHFYLSHLLGFLIGISWYLIIFLTDREKFINHYLLSETINKWKGNGSTPLGMWLDFSTFSMPFTVLLIFGIIHIKALMDLSYKKIFFLVTSIIFPALFFSFFPYRTETYLFIILPSFIIWMDWSMSSLLMKESKTFPLWITRINGLFIFILGSFATFIFYLGRMLSIKLGIVLFLSCFSFSFFSWSANWRKMAFSCLLIVNTIRLGAISLGEKDIYTFKKIVKQHPDRKVSFYDEGRNIWHEIGILSVATGKVSNRVFSPTEAIRTIEDQGILVVNDFQSLSLMPIILERFSGNPHLREINWRRWKRGFQVPSLQDLLQLENPTTNAQNSKNRKTYKIIFLDG